MLQPSHNVQAASNFVTYRCLFACFLNTPLLSLYPSKQRHACRATQGPLPLTCLLLEKIIGLNSCMQHYGSLYTKNLPDENKKILSCQIFLM